jgi:hypothetical protein
LATVQGDLPAAVASLFWDVDPSSVDLEAHRDYVIERVMTRGGWEAMKWLRRTYDRDQLGAFLLRKGSRLPPRELAYWSLIAEVDLLAGPGGGRPRWAGP